MVTDALTAKITGNCAAIADPPPLKLNGEGFQSCNPLRIDLHESRRFNAQHRAPATHARAAILNRRHAAVIGDDKACARRTAVTWLEQNARVADADKLLFHRNSARFQFPLTCLNHSEGSQNWCLRRLCKTGDRYTCKERKRQCQ